MFVGAVKYSRDTTRIAISFSLFFCSLQISVCDCGSVLVLPTFDYSVTSRSCVCSARPC